MSLNLENGQQTAFVREVQRPGYRIFRLLGLAYHYRRECAGVLALQTLLVLLTLGTSRPDRSGDRLSLLVRESSHGISTVAAGTAATESAVTAVGHCGCGSLCDYGGVADCGGKVSVCLRLGSVIAENF
ncbi:MAG UNVERIFIED_CONTAM: hypothetical protein LVR18_25515 [Planctomycetaceae bacterium]